jgi:hypothetical protein
MQITFSGGRDGQTGDLARKSQRRPPFMSLDVLLQKLSAIERAIGVAHNNTVRGLVYDAEGYLLDMRWESLAAMGHQDSDASRRIPYVREIAEAGPPGLDF